MINKVERLRDLYISIAATKLTSVEDGEITDKFNSYSYEETKSYLKEKFIKSNFDIPVKEFIFNSSFTEEQEALIEEEFLKTTTRQLAFLKDISRISIKSNNIIRYTIHKMMGVELYDIPNNSKYAYINDVYLRKKDSKVLKDAYNWELTDDIESADFLVYTDKTSDIMRTYNIGNKPLIYEEDLKFHAGETELTSNTINPSVLNIYLCELENLNLNNHSDNIVASEKMKFFAAVLNKYKSNDIPRDIRYRFLRIASAYYDFNRQLENSEVEMEIYRRIVPTEFRYVITRRFLKQSSFSAISTIKYPKADIFYKGSFQHVLMVNDYIDKVVETDIENGNKYNPYWIGFQLKPGDGFYRIIPNKTIAGLKRFDIYLNCVSNGINILTDIDKNLVGVDICNGGSSTFNNLSEDKIKKIINKTKAFYKELNIEEDLDPSDTVTPYFSYEKLLIYESFLDYLRKEMGTFYYLENLIKVFKRNKKVYLNINKIN